MQETKEEVTLQYCKDQVAKKEKCFWKLGKTFEKHYRNFVSWEEMEALKSAEFMTEKLEEAVELYASLKLSSYKESYDNQCRRIEELEKAFEKSLSMLLVSNRRYCLRNHNAIEDLKKVLNSKATR